MLVIRVFLAALVSLLVLSMQHEALVHALGHDRARLAAPNKAVLQGSVDTTCSTCTLIAGGVHGLTGASGHAPYVFPEISAAHHHASGRFAPAPVWYASRAPPVLTL